MSVLPTPPLWPVFSACVFLGCYGGFQLRGQLDPFGAHQLPSYPSHLRGREPRARAAAAPGGLSSRPGRTRPGSHPAPAWHREGNWQTGTALPGGGEGDRGSKDMRTTATPRPGQVRQRGCGGAWVPARKERLWGGSRDPRARPAHRGRSGLRPGAFRAQAATRLGKSRPPSGRRGLAGQSGGGDSRNLPGDRRRVTGQNRPIYGQRFRCVSGESPGARQWTGLRLRTARLAPGILPQVLGGWARSAPWTFQPPGSGYARRVGHPGWGCEMPGQSWRRDTNSTNSTERATNSSGVWVAQHSPPSARPASKKETTEINKESFFFLLK